MNTLVIVVGICGLVITLCLMIVLVGGALDYLLSLGWRDTLARRHLEARRREQHHARR